MATKEVIILLEEKLVEAMKSSNVATLETLLADDLIFTNHNGQVLTKEADIDAHLSGELEIYSIETSDQLITLTDDVAVVSVIQDLSGTFGGHAFVGIYRYTRVWKNTGNAWQVIAAHASQVIG